MSVFVHGNRQRRSAYANNRVARVARARRVPWVNGQEGGIRPSPFLAIFLSLSFLLARIPTLFASLLASLSLPRPAACTHEALAQATVTAPYIFPDSSGGGGSRVTIDIKVALAGVRSRLRSLHSWKYSIFTIREEKEGEGEEKGWKDRTSPCTSHRFYVLLLPS